MNLKKAYKILSEHMLEFTMTNEIHMAVAEDEWQKFRVNLKGESTKTKLCKLADWLVEHGYSHKSKVQVTNYINALKRGGQLFIDMRIKR